MRDPSPLGRRETDSSIHVAGARPTHQSTSDFSSVVCGSNGVARKGLRLHASFQRPSGAHGPRPTGPSCWPRQANSNSGTKAEARQRAWGHWALRKRSPKYGLGWASKQLRAGRASETRLTRTSLCCSTRPVLRRSLTKIWDEWTGQAQSRSGERPPRARPNSKRLDTIRGLCLGWPRG
jgi:hypothetical protein